MDQGLLYLEHITELSKDLTLDDVAKLLFFLQVPAGICDKNCDQFVFYELCTLGKNSNHIYSTKQTSESNSNR